MKFHLGYYVNRYSGWHIIRHFDEPIQLVRWLKINAVDIDGAIDFLVEK
jgi:hypothetical protein